MLRRLTCLALIVLTPLPAVAGPVTVPFGTTVFFELGERVTSKKKETSEGDLVRAHVWKDVWVEGSLVIKAGTPAYARVSKVKKAKVAGIKGQLEIEVLNVTAVDGRDVPLDGGYDKSGRGRMGLSIALAAVVAWPLIFIKGKQAILEPGVIFDGIVRSPVEVVADAPRDRPRIVVRSPLEVTVLYDELDPESKIRDLPLELRYPEGGGDRATVIAINGESIPPLAIRLEGGGGDGVVRGAVDFKALSKHFNKGMNRFVVQMGDEEAEVLLEIEF